MGNYDVKNIAESVKMRDFDRHLTSKVVKKAQSEHPVKIIKNSEECVIIVNYQEYLKLINKDVR